MKSNNQAIFHIIVTQLGWGPFLASNARPPLPGTQGKHICEINTPLYPTFMQGFTYFFLFLLQNIDCGYSLEPPRQGGSNLYPQSMFCAKIRKISTISYRKFSFFYNLKNLCILHGHDFVMRESNNEPSDHKAGHATNSCHQELL